MATRSAFTVSDGKVKELKIDFTWVAGFDVIKTKENIKRIHEKISDKHPLEVSTASEMALGKSASAFNLKLNGKCFESVYHSAKKFENGGPFTDLMSAAPAIAKKDKRLTKSGKLIAFTYENEDWGIDDGFYDFYYIKALYSTMSREDIEDIISFFGAYTDVYFNAEKQFNTQTRALAILKAAYQSKNLDCLNTSSAFIQFRHECLI